MTVNPAAKREVKTKPYWLLIALAPLIPAFFRAVRAYLESRFGRGYVDWHEIIISLVDWAILGGLTPLVYVLAKRYPIKQPRITRALLAHSFGVVATCILWGIGGIILSGLSGTGGVVLAGVENRLPWQGNFLKSFVPWLSILLSYSLLIYVLMLGCVSAFLYYREARERESQQARLAAQLAAARLNALRMQLNPHFLFNSLNAISVLVRDQKSDEASQMLELLSDVLREVLQSKQHAETKLSEELAFIEKYLTIEQMRFSDRLEVRWSIQPIVREALVPEFILQPIVENAIRHGIAQQTEAGIIEIEAREAEGELILTVRDNGPGYRPVTAEGLGLSNTRERLSTIYGHAGQLLLMPADEEGTVATVRFPVRRAS